MVLEYALKCLRRWLMRRCKTFWSFRSYCRFDCGNFWNELFLAEGQQWPHLTFLNEMWISTAGKTTPGVFLAVSKISLERKTHGFHSRLRKWKVLWVYLVLHWLVKKSRAKMDGMLDAESQQEIQLLLSWMKGLSLLCISFKKTSKISK